MGARERQLWAVAYHRPAPPDERPQRRHLQADAGCNSGVRRPDTQAVGRCGRGRRQARRERNYWYL